MSAELIDQANELAELQREAAIAKCRINHNAVSATHCCDCRLAIPELRRKYVPGVTQCIDCAEYTERKSKQFRG
ncbi:TPA: TraR/DksA family transcriptional regulator [Klebsiella pneumoniae]|uniref:TraR/DksA family transcriptional regulator n=1 Tax=Klebsiella pneumoniae TaxID=573 RepID=UPI001866C0FD|nr:TraR/DksA family transcriptional regulator [Klebsiella pneumoniae]